MPTSGPQRDDPAPEPDLTEVEGAVIRALVSADGRRLRIDELAVLTHQPNLIVQRVVTRLDEAGFLSISYNYLHGPSCALTSAGQDVAMRNGWLVPNPLA